MPHGNLRRTGPDGTPGVRVRLIQHERLATPFLCYFLFKSLSLSLRVLSLVVSPGVGEREMCDKDGRPAEKKKSAIRTIRRFYLRRADHAKRRGSLREHPSRKGKGISIGKRMRQDRDTERKGRGRGGEGREREKLQHSRYG